MIQLTTLNGETVYLNPFQFEKLDAVPDTQITMMNGHRYFVAETPETVCTAIAAWLRGGVPGAGRRPWSPADGEG